eukprot:TRINITY_DN16999_c0_g1_i1.p2 TRINITY_DN16999_c0_g1~~TRINITY_DN16999_c0_g1_i1.p2  ORF type:complete len:168 (+),score=37.07 TRINITY_DN16999_c0_g1_i1:42-506(+)
MAEEALRAVRVEPIGVVRSSFKETIHKGYCNFCDQQADLVIRPELAEGLDGVEEYSTLLVLFRFHLTSDVTKLRVHPRGDESRPMRGVFSTCSPNRPNHIGMTKVELVSRSGNVLHVRGLDAVDGTPVLDLHPCDKNDQANSERQHASPLTVPL